MADLPDRNQLTEIMNQALLQLQTALTSAEIWIQLGVIIAVYFLASALFTPSCNAHWFAWAPSATALAAYIHW